MTIVRDPDLVFIIALFLIVAGITFEIKPLITFPLSGLAGYLLGVWMAS